MHEYSKQRSRPKQQQEAIQHSQTAAQQQRQVSRINGVPKDAVRTARDQGVIREDGGFVNALPMLHSRWVAAMNPARGDVLDELVTIRSTDVELGPAFTGSFELAVHDAPGEELTSLAPVEPIAGYWRQVGATFEGGEPVFGEAATPLR